MTEPMQPTHPEDGAFLYDGEPEGPPYRLIFIALGGLTALALILAVVKASRPTGQSGLGVNPVETGGSWEESLRHLAAASDFRFQNIEQRLEELSGMKVQATAATSVPAQPLMPVDESMMNGAAQHPDVGAMEPPPPGPAAVSVMPDDQASN